MVLAAGDLRARSMAGYEIVRRLAAGGMAEVYLARQVVAGHMERAVVLKVPLPHLADETSFLRMFRTEAALAAQLQHPNIVSILDVAEVDGLPCIVMEYLQGLDVRDALVRLARTGRRVPPGVAVMIALGTALGLGYAHRKKTPDGKPLSIVHRDVSPHNLFLTRDGGVKLLDFGVAKSAAQIEKTKTGVVKGKLAYLAPEQLTTNKLDGRTDQWSLGVVLWEMLAAKRLFRRDGGEALILNAVLNDPIPPPSTLGAPESLDPIVLRCLSRKPEARYPTCEDLAADLQHFLRGVGARPETLALAEFVEQLEASSSPAREQPSASSVDEELRTISASASIPSGVVATVSSSGFEIPEMPLDASPSEPPPVDDEAGRVTHPTGSLVVPSTLSGPTPLTMTPAIQRDREQRAITVQPDDEVALRPKRWPLFVVATAVALLVGVAIVLVIVTRLSRDAVADPGAPAATPSAPAATPFAPATPATLPAAPVAPADPTTQAVHGQAPASPGSRSTGDARDRGPGRGRASPEPPPVAPPAQTRPLATPSAGATPAPVRRDPLGSGTAREPGLRERPTTGRDIDRSYP